MSYTSDSFGVGVVVLHDIDGGFTPNPYSRVQRELDSARARVLELEELRRRVARFGEDGEYDDGTVISWSRTWPDRGTTYSYVALKAGESWWITGREYRQGISFERLVADFLVNADDDRVYIVERWGSL